VYGIGSVTLTAATTTVIADGTGGTGSDLTALDSGTILGGTLTATGAVIIGTDATDISAATFTFSKNESSHKLSIADSGYATNIDKAGIVTFTDVTITNGGVSKTLAPFHIGIKT
jgi:hypothetical protein